MTADTLKIQPQYAIDPPPPGYTRWKIVVEYNGTGYSGWQRQQGVPTVQAVVEQAIFQFSSERVHVQCAGRTDAGVHATGQVAHFDLHRPMTPYGLRGAINNFLGGTGVCVVRADVAANDFHARFSAQNRVYLYRILNRRAQPTFTAGTVWHIAKPLNVEAMHHAGQVLVGTHDFTTFRASECQSSSPIKTIDSLVIKRAEPNLDLPPPLASEIHMHIGAKSFLHHQVRNIIGTLQLVGLGSWTVDHVQRALEAKHRSAGGKTAPPYGLYLTHVGY